VALGFQKFFASAPGLIVANAFQHVAATYDVASGMCVLYLNGAIVAEQNFGSFTPNTIYDLYLGTRQIYGTWYWAGVLDEFSLYDRALSASEVAAIYTADNAGKCASAPPVLAIEPDGGGYLIRITATPGSTCRLQRAPTVRGPWSTSAPLTAPASGLVQFRDLFPPPGQGFYRVVQP
jgi:hypothetical protein